MNLLSPPGQRSLTLRRGIQVAWQMGSPDQHHSDMLAGADIRLHPVSQRDAHDGGVDEFLKSADWVRGAVRHSLLVR